MSNADPNMATRDSRWGRIFDAWDKVDLALERAVTTTSRGGHLIGVIIILALLLSNDGCPPSHLLRQDIPSTSPFAVSIGDKQKIYTAGEKPERLARTLH